MTTRTVRCHCPYCNHVVDAATEATGDAAPKPGDFTVCYYCAAVTRFDDNMAIRKLTKKEAQETAKCEDLQQVVGMIKRERARRYN